MHAYLDILGFLLNFSLSLFGDSDLEEIAKFFNIFFIIRTVRFFWEIGNLKVLLDRLFEINDFLMEHLALI
jgi:hypothetical protein